LSRAPHIHSDRIAGKNSRAERLLPATGHLPRDQLWELQIAKYRRDAKDFDIVQLGRATEGLTGSEIENAFVEALYLAFDRQKEPTDLDIAGVLTEFVPLSKLMAEQINGLRQWSRGRARLATSSVSGSGLRKMVV
jgi:hypothetical protein